MLARSLSISLALSLDLARALSVSASVSLACVYARAVSFSRALSLDLARSLSRSCSPSLCLCLCLCLCLSRTLGDDDACQIALQRALSLHPSSTLTLSLTLSLTQPCHHCSPQPTCRGEGTCAPDVSNGGTGAGGGHCLCNRHYFAKDCSIKLKPKWSLEYVVSDITVSHMVQ